jgi:tRNA threonylcarbamoyladenosine biosynthesis protein TsaE
MTEYAFEATDEAATDRFGAALAAALPTGAVVCLLGTLGAGKTRLVQAIAAARGVAREDVVSPTFVLLQQYEGDALMNHLDAYRVRDDDEFRAIGIEELFASDAITIIEWADRVAATLPDDRLQIEIEVTGPTSRRFVVKTIGDRYLSVIEGLKRQMRESRP